jgi:SAM-dependent methyltransferase
VGQGRMMFVEHYVEWRQKRFDRIVSKYGKEFFKDKTMLEVGCGFGDLGNMFYALGAKVICVDGREEHVKVLKKKYPHLSAYVADLNVGLGIKKFFDIILHTGVLYHLEDYVQPIIDSCLRCNHLILETEVSDSVDPHFCWHVKEPSAGDQSLTGRGVKPSPYAVERVLKEQNFVYERIFDGLDCHFHSYDWPEENDESYEDDKQLLRRRAFWFCRRVK